MKHIIYNPASNNGKGKETADLLVTEMTDYKLETVGDVSYEDYLSGLPAGDEVILVGGDGTLNAFCNIVRGKELLNKFYFYKAGSGNDFFRDLENTGRIEKNMICLNDLISDLPVVTVNGKERVFINGVGFGIDGYCCEEGDKQRAVSDKPVNYAGIAVKGLLFKYKPLKATVTVDGVTKTYKKVWLAPTMKGRFYGGGMMIAPDQDRFDEKKKVTSVVLTGGKLPVLMLFPSIFEGKHTDKVKHVHILEGKSVKVVFNRPTALQIDGETVKNVTEYTVRV